MSEIMPPGLGFNSLGTSLSPGGLLIVLAPVGLLIVLTASGGCTPLDRSPSNDLAYQTGPVSPWPRPIPMRIKPAQSGPLLVTTLGPVQTPLADGVFDPSTDRVTLHDGTVIEDYYKKELDIPFFEPLDKSAFPVPPSGWCSWYYYYQEINSDEVMANARWIARHLKPFGARYVQIDDGWQGTGHGLGDNRDWTTIDVRFRALGMDGLAREIRALGLEAGLWLAPHGQSNEQVARDAGGFLWKPDGTTASDTWEGTYLVDPSTPGGLRHLRNLFNTLRGWGYTYFKIDGQPIVVGEYADKAEFMAGEVNFEGTAEERADHLYRVTLRVIRDAIGENAFLLGCWGIPLQGIGIFNGSRTSGDVVPGWAGFMVAARAVQRWNFLHNIAWYSDPDVFMVRPPLTEGMARAWATIQGLTGQALLTSDRLPDLPPSRIEILKRIYPAVDIRPLDLFRDDGDLKPIWDLKVAHLGRRYDVVGLFNYDDQRAETGHLRWEDLGLRPDQCYHVYDFWQGMYLGAWSRGVFIEVPPADVRVLTLVAARDEPVLVSTSRHITQGWVDLLSLTSSVRGTQPMMTGRSRLVADDPYTLTIGLPAVKPSFAIDDVSITRGRGVDVAYRSHQGYATVTLRSRTSQDVSWRVRFKAAEPYTYPSTGPTNLTVTPTGMRAADLSFGTPYHEFVAYQVSVDGTIIGYAFHPRAVLADLVGGRTYRIGVQAVWYDAEGEGGAEVEHVQTAPSSLYLSDVKPDHATQDWGQLGRDRSVDGNPLRVGGQEYQKGLGSHANSTVTYRIDGVFKRFTARVGIDDEAATSPPVQVVFEVWGDGRKLWHSDPVETGQAAVPVSVDVTRVGTLELRLVSVGDSIDYQHADWLEARLDSESGTP